MSVIRKIEINKTAVKNSILNSEHIHLIILLLISITSRFPFVLNGFGESDSANLAVSIIDFINHGKEGYLTYLYFIDVVPLYVVYIKYCMKILDYNYIYLTTVMNYTNAVVGTLMVVPAYLFIKRLFDNRSIAFYTVLTFIFVPSVYQASIYGFPHLIALFFFITSLYFFLIWIDDTGYFWLILFCVSLAVAISFKSDFILGSGAYLGLLYMRKVKDKKRIALSFLVIIFSIASFLILRHWMIGIDKGYTTSPSNIMDWFIYFFKLLLTRGIAVILKEQISPIIYGIGVMNFVSASIALAFYIVKRRTDVLVLVFSWTALPTVLWLLLHTNSARHNMLSVLPFIMIIYLFVYEKAPRFIAVIPIMLVLGNFLVTPPSKSNRNPSGNLFQSQVLLDDWTNNLHLTAEKIAEMDNDKIIFTRDGFRPFLYYEIFSLVPSYEMIKVNDFCYMLKGLNKKCIICDLSRIEADSSIDIIDIISEYHEEEYTIVVPEINFIDFDVLKEEGYQIYRYNPWNVNTAA